MLLSPPLLLPPPPPTLLSESRCYDLCRHTSEDYSGWPAVHPEGLSACGRAPLSVLGSDLPLSPPITELSICPSSLALPGYCVDTPTDVSLSLLHFHTSLSQTLRTAWTFPLLSDLLAEAVVTDVLLSLTSDSPVHFSRSPDFKWCFRVFQRRRASPACQYPLVIPLHRHLLLFHRVQSFAVCGA